MGRQGVLQGGHRGTGSCGRKLIMMHFSRARSGSLGLMIYDVGSEPQIVNGRVPGSDVAEKRCERER